MIITLTTDFGLSDPFVGVMKGVILSIAPNVQIIDLTHDIRSYDILEAAFLLDSAFGFFPPGTIHLVIVDPGVGSSRRPLAASARGHIFVGPDNGVLAYVLDSPPRATMPEVYHITNESMFQNPISQTFHGRDIFAPVAAHLARGAPIDSVGARIIDYVKKAVSQPKPHGHNCLLATVLRIDKFGNIITNLRKHHLRHDFCIHVGGIEVSRMVSCYADAGLSEFFAIEGSTGHIEIALNQGSAADKLNIQRGSEIEVETGYANH